MVTGRKMHAEMTARRQAQQLSQAAHLRRTTDASALDKIAHLERELARVAHLLDLERVSRERLQQEIIKLADGAETLLQRAV